MADFLETISLLRASSVSVFANPNAGRQRANLYLPLVQELFCSLNISVQTAITGSAVELESEARKAISQGQRVLFAMGGDGTFQALANASFGSDAILGILPVGGGNDFAAALGIPSNLHKVLASMAKYVTRPVDLVKVLTADGKTRLYAGGGGLGLDAEAACYASGTYRHLPGRFRYVAAALKALYEHLDLRVRVEFPETDCKPVEASCLLTCVLNTPTYGGGLRLASDAQIDDALINVALVEPLGAIAVLRLLPGLLLTGELRTSRIRRWQVKRVRLVSDRACFFHGDGEILGPAPVQIEVVPGAARVLAPAAN